ncbi:TetR family transcriptional regulator [Sphaerotilus hippei]|uniref:TetR family transcriptional regulator n=1 Tax=Sphaerotilus hippei TaxID=744406 RepID=A0A318GU72_9BURK|nr:TetR/AcrR family transcriptional regulator [Sphaerotilus hippei]PXW91975.1 TetR family transcriptional regulator [Sphaerotilus hippei]
MDSLSRQSGTAPAGTGSRSCRSISTGTASQKTREKLLDAAEELFLKQGFSCTTQENIAEIAGLSRGAFRWHFDSKCSILRAVLERRLWLAEYPAKSSIDEEAAEISEHLAKLALKPLQHLDDEVRLLRLMGVIRNSECHSLLIDPAWNEKLISSHRANEICTLIQALKLEGRLEQTVDPQYAALGLLAIGHGLAAQCSLGLGSDAAIASGRLAVKTYLDGLGLVISKN